MPDASTTAIIAASASGLVGVTVGGWLQTRTSRGQQLRDRMLAAADDFSTGAQQAATQLYVLYDAVPRNAGAHLDEYARLVREVEARLARVVLLFGPRTPAAEAAEALASSLDVARKSAAVQLQNVLILRGDTAVRVRLLGIRRTRKLTWAPADEQQLAEAQAAVAVHMDVIADDLAEFSEAAWRAMQTPGRWRRSQVARYRIRAWRYRRSLEKQLSAPDAP